MNSTEVDHERTQFLRELDEHLARIDALLADHREHGRPATRCLVVDAARALHSIRGIAALVGLPELAAPAHAAEDALVGAEMPGWSAGAFEASVTALRLAAPAVEARTKCHASDPALAIALARLANEVAAERGALVALTVEGDVWATGLVALAAQLVTNAAAHGIEPPATRLAAGKPARGHISVRTWTAAGAGAGAETIIEVADDGAGFDEPAIRDAAAARGLTARDDARSAAELAFLHGVTTRSAVTFGAGRGVGLDIVRTIVDAADGRVDVTTTSGVGSTVRLLLPSG
jgi:chemotaxis protein histidine kinase CheA